MPVSKPYNGTPRLYSAAIKTAEAEFNAVTHQHRHFIAEQRLQFLPTIDVYEAYFFCPLTILRLPFQ
jgi:hypothetical protein